MAWLRGEEEIYWDAMKIVVSMSIKFMPIYPLGHLSEVSDKKRAQEFRNK